MINFYKGYIDCAPTNASGNISHVAGKFSFKIHVAESHIFEELGWGGGAWITVTRGWDVVWDGWGRRYRTLKSTRGVVESIKKLTMKRGGEGYGALNSWKLNLEVDQPSHDFYHNFVSILVDAFIGFVSDWLIDLS